MAHPGSHRTVGAVPHRGTLEPPCQVQEERAPRTEGPGEVPGPAGLASLSWTRRPLGRGGLHRGTAEAGVTGAAPSLGVMGPPILPTQVSDYPEGFLET